MHSYQNINLIKENIQKSNDKHTPLFIIILATKPCYIKLYSLIREFDKNNLPYLLIETGQHYSQELVNHKFEYKFYKKISVTFDSNDDLLLKSINLINNIDILLNILRENKLLQKAVPVVSGDTISAGHFAQYWFLRTQIRSIHIEAGLRSYAPFKTINYNTIDLVRNQQKNKWVINREMPFPETDCSRIASQFSDLLFAPVKLNFQNLINEGYNKNNIIISGSLSADAISNVKLFITKRVGAIFKKYPILKMKEWIRIDLHRRENMSFECLEPLLSAIESFTTISNGNVILIMSNLFDKAVPIKKLTTRFRNQIKSKNILITPVWENYSDVIEFIDSPNCLGVVTDSGGLQEELTLLDKPCFIYRNSTDRLEAILYTNNNLLLYPFTEKNIKSALAILQNTLFKNRLKNKLSQNGIYGVSVASKITNSIIKYYKI